MKKEILSIKNTYTKVSAIVYDKEVLMQFKDYCIKKDIKYYYIKHIAKNEKKEHYHFIIASDTNHRFNIKTLVSEKQPINLFEKCKNVACNLRYMLHIDYIDKEHYKVNDIVSNDSLHNIIDMVDSVGNRNKLEKVNLNEILPWIDKAYRFCYNNSCAFNYINVYRFLSDKIVINSVILNALKTLIREYTGSIYNDNVIVDVERM